MDRRDRLARRRKTLGLTQADLAALLRVERSTVVRWERGATQPAPWLRPRLARALKVSPEQIEALLADAEPVPPAGASATMPRQLPAAVPEFTGRAAELETLTQMLEDAGASGPGTVIISAIGGMAGVGKTALALFWAHRIADRFPDGQLHVNLRGFDPSGPPVSPAQAVRRFLDALGVPPERIPQDPDAQAGLYRSLLAGKRTLILLDNARDEGQVRPLLPASPASLVLVTSRNALAGLAATDGARLLHLDVLSHDEAVRLLTARLGHARAAAEPSAIGEIAALCACLPLALAVAAARASARPDLTLSALAVELREGAGRLDALDSGDPAASVRAVFSWSYEQLAPDAARMFRLLGLHLGPDVTPRAAASLAATTEPEARRLLRDLTRGCLITEHVPGRYAFHDLLRAYAGDQAREHDSESERRAAVGRVLDHYLHTAHAAAILLTPSREPITLGQPVPGAAPARPVSYQQAMAWFQAEHNVLLAAVLLAESSSDSHTWQLPWAMADYFLRRGHWAEWVRIQGKAVAAAMRLGDIAAQATCRQILANALVMAGDYEQAGAHLRYCLELYQRLGHRLSQANVQYSFARLAESQSRYADALEHTERALQLFRAAGEKGAEVEMLNNVGWYLALLGDYQQARAICRQALTLNADVGNRLIEGNIWDTLGYAEDHLGNFTEAAACYQRAISIAREGGDRPSEAQALVHLGDTWHAGGEPLRAKQAWREALAILDETGHPDAEEVRAKLAGP
jgi:tetratricopeptide (TPR) repeat protein/transcriptional regulator with XRE-family HTH domain